jgi:hypothetical protein
MEHESSYYDANKDEMQYVSFVDCGYNNMRIFGRKHHL